MKHIKTSKTLNCIIGIFIAFALFVASFFGFVFKPNIKNEPISASVETETINTIRDSNFDSSKNTSFPITPSASNYESFGNNSSTNGSYGIINLDPEISTKYTNKFPKNPARNTGDTNENYVLMLSSAKDNTIDEPNYQNVKNGYKTTDGQIKLENDSNYIIGVDVLTLDKFANGIGAIYLYDADNNDKILAQIENISTVKSPDTSLSDLERTEWKRCYFLVSTNDLTTYNLKLGMFINGSGDVLFDNISIQKVSDKALASFKLELENDPLKNNYYSVIEKDISNVIASYTANNSDNNYNIEFNYEGVAHTLDVLASEPDGTVDFSNHLVVNNNNEAFTLNKNINLTKNKIYKITTYIKAEKASNTTLNLVQTNLADGHTAKTAKLTINAKPNVNNAKNGFVPYSFYALTDAESDSEFKLTLAVGSLTDDNSTGNADLYISRIVVENCAYKHFSSTNSNSTTLNMVSPANNTYFTNGNFSNIEIEDYSLPYPAKPSNWTVVDPTNGSNSIYGVINNGQKSELESLGNLTDDILGAIPVNYKNTNMLMLYTNAEGNELSYLSPSYTCSADSYYKFSARALAPYKDATLSLITTRNGQEITLASRVIHGDMFTNENNVATLYLHTGYQSVDVSLKITVKAKDGVSLAFLDDVKAETSTSGEEFANQLSSATKDLGFAINSTNFTLGSINNAVVSINSLNDLEETIPDATDNNVLFIDATNPTTLTYNSNYGFTFKTDSFYKLSLSVYTKNLTAYNTKDERNDDLASISFGLTSYENFKSVKSVNGFTTYTFYIKPSSETTSNLTFTLGSNDAKVTGEIYIANIQFETLKDMKEEEFNKIPANANTLILTSVTENTDEEDTTTEEKPKEKKSGFNWQNFSYILSSLIFALSIVVAIVGLVSRKFKGKIKLPNKKTKNAYDRQKTVSKQVSSREAAILREQKIAELTAELNTLVEERTKYEQDYKKDLTTLRELKIKRANANEIKELEKELKKNQKRTAALGVNVAKLENEIEYAKSNMYLSALIKKLEREGRIERIVEDNEEEQEKTEVTEQKTNNKVNTTTKPVKKTEKNTKTKSTSKTKKEVSSTKSKTTKSTTTKAEQPKTNTATKSTTTKSKSNKTKTTK